MRSEPRRQKWGPGQRFSSRDEKEILQNGEEESCTACEFRMKKSNHFRVEQKTDT